MTKSLTDIVQGAKKAARGIAAAGLIGATMLFSNGCGTPPVEKPKPTAILTVEKSQVQSGQENKIEVDGTIGGDPLVDKISKYYLRGPVDFGASLPLQTNIPVDVFLTYFTNEQMNIPLEAQVESNKGVLSDKVYASYQVNPKIVEDYINLSGVIEDSETDSPLAGAKVRCYRADKTFITEVTADEDGFWTADWLKYEGDDKIIIQAGDYPNYFISTFQTLNEDKDNLYFRLVSNDNPDFYEFVYDVWGVVPWRFDSTDFKEFIIFPENPEGKGGSFSPSRVSFIEDKIVDSTGNLEKMLKLPSPVITTGSISDPISDIHTIHILPDSSLPFGTADTDSYSEGRVNTGGIIRVHPDLDDNLLQALLYHELGHSAGISNHPKKMISIMYLPVSYMEYQPVDLKITKSICQNSTFLGTPDGVYPKAVNYTPNILRTEWGFEGTIGY